MAYEYKEYEYVENCLMKAGEILKELLSRSAKRIFTASSVFFCF